MVEAFLITRIIVCVVKDGSHLKMVREWQVTHFSNTKQRSVERLQNHRRDVLSVL